MSDELLPWDPRPADFSKPGWHTRRWAVYMLLFRFLRISPSYELARRERTGELTPEEIASLPRDFDEVRQTYQLLGNVKGGLFRAWWLKRGLRAFGNPYSKPQVQELASFSHGQAASVADCIAPIEQYLEQMREQQGKPATLILGIPLNMQRREILGQLNRLLKAELPDDPPQMPKPKLQLMGERLHPRKLYSGLRLLTIRAYRPDWEHWRVGTRAGFSKKYSKEPDAAKGPRFTKDPDERLDRIVLGKLTYRALEKYKAIAENAARGRFPCDAPVEMANFDWAAIGRSLRRIAKFEKSEKERLLKLREQRTKARESAELIGISPPVAPSA